MTPLYAAALDRYMHELLPVRDVVRAEMEREAAERDIPIVGPAVAALLEILAVSIGAKRVFELGSAIGYSTVAFARAVGPEGKVFYTDGDEKNAREAAGYLTRLGLMDIDKDGYPRALETAAPRVRPGGYLLADNTLWSGRVVDRDVRDTATEGIREFNRRLFARTDFRAVIVPLRDGVAIARKEA
jgi:caffeoyl-CoA O-methyltransferase